MAVRILVIDSDLQLARLLESELAHEGYRVWLAHDGISGFVAVRELQPDLLIMDTALPQFSGLEICNRLRSTFSALPIILLSNQTAIRDRVAGLDAGADDYLLKPFDLDELLARVRSQLRKANIIETTHSLMFESLVLNKRTREVYRQNRHIALTRKEFDLLEYFMSHPRQALTREQIITTIWGYDFIGEGNVVEVYVRYLRRKLEENHEPRLIHTIRGVGYTLKEPSNALASIR